MLHTVDKAVSSSDGKVLANPTYQNDAALPLYRTYFWKIPSWTIVTIFTNIMNELYRRMANRTENYVFLKMTALYNLLHKLFL